MKPNSENYNPSPVYLRSLIEQTGLSQRKAAKVIGVSERVMRNYLSLNPNDHTKCPYPVQYCLECLAKKTLLQGDWATPVLHTSRTPDTHA